MTDGIKDIEDFRYRRLMADAPTSIRCCAPLTGTDLSDEHATELERVFKALADRHRLRIVNRLLQADGAAICVCDFEALLGLAQPTVSYHLKQLLTAGLVEREKRGAYAYFSLDADGLSRLRDLLPQAPAASAEAAA